MPICKARPALPLGLFQGSNDLGILPQRPQALGHQFQRRAAVQPNVRGRAGRLVQQVHTKGASNQSKNTEVPE
jgi:hypothetical protein